MQVAGSLPSQARLHGGSDNTCNVEPWNLPAKVRHLLFTVNRYIFTRKSQFYRLKKLPLLITTAVIALVAGALLLFHYLSKQEKTSAWDLVPAETVLVYESGECAKCIADMRNIPLAEIIKRAAFYEQPLDSLAQLGELMTSFQQPTLVSLHITKKENFDFVFYLPYNNNTELRFNLLLEKFSTTKGIKTLSRVYEGVEIRELKYRKSVFSYIILDGNWVGSFTPVLIEDVIRTYVDPEKRTFRKEVSSVYQLSKLKNDGGNVYLHLQNFANWFSLFTNEKPNYLIKQFGQSALLDIKLDEEQKLVLNGFSIEKSATDNFVLSTFQDQSPIPFTLKHFVPNRSLVFASYGISDGKTFYEGLKKIRKTPSDSLTTLASSLKLNIDNVFSDFTGEIGIAWAEGRKESVSKLMFVQSSKGINQWLKTFNSISEQLSIDTVFYEKYGDYEIRDVPVYRFPEKLLGPLVTGFDRTYYTSSGNVLILAEDFELLKKYLDDVDREDTWGKSVAQNAFLESTLLESNISLFVNTPRVWSVIAKNLHPRWQQFVGDNKSLFNSLGMGAIQFSHLNDSYYTNISWEANRKTNGDKNEDAADKFMVNFENAIASMAVVKNHQDKSDEILVQDSAKNLTLVSSEGRVLWQVQLPDFITSEVHQIDYLANGKLQYFFTTPGKLHVIDRLGSYVAPYPLNIDEQQIEYTAVVDYDHTRKYRFLVAGNEGKLWMFDKEGKNLEGWQPRIVDEGLATTPRHHRLVGKDYILAIRKDGFAYLMNRRGELLKNFPLDLNARFSGDYFIDPGKNRSTTEITVIDRDGKRIKFNLEGKILSQEVLVKVTPNAKFWMVTEAEREAYLIVRQEAALLTIFDDQLNEIIKSDFIANNPVSISYQNFGNGKNYIVLTDLTQQLSFVYTAKGELLTTLPVDSQSLVVKPDQSGQVKLYSFLGNNVTIGLLP
jgi:hypothetical protein